MVKTIFFNFYFSVTSIALLFVCFEADKIIQSELCTTDEIEAYTQCFRKLPEKDYFIPRGYTVILPCEITNQHGKAQWRAKDVLLG